MRAHRASVGGACFGRMLRQRQTPGAGWDTQKAGPLAGLLACTGPLSVPMRLPYIIPPMSAMPPPMPASAFLGGSATRLGHEDVLRDRGGVLQRGARDHRRVDDARLDQGLRPRPCRRSTACSMPRFSAIGFAPAGTFFKALAHNRLCEQRRRGRRPRRRSVEVATSRTSCAPWFSKASSTSISRAIVTPSFVIVGAPNFLSSTTYRPFGGPRKALLTRTSLEPYASAATRFVTGALLDSHAITGPAVIFGVFGSASSSFCSRTH